MKEGHGGNVNRLAAQLGCGPEAIVDMSANVNPLGPLPDLLDHLKNELSSIASLPEVNAAGMVQTFSRAHDLDPARVLAGNGTTELIYLIPKALQPAKALVIGPTYSDYADACTLSRVPCAFWTSRETDNFVPSLSKVREAAASADLVFLCNPNNPTGTLITRRALTDLCQSLPRTVFVIDEAYLPFVPQPEKQSLIKTNLSNVVVLNSMSKAFRIPGLRIGFAVAPRPIIEKLSAYTLPWSVNSMAQTAVIWLMTHLARVDQFLKATRTLIVSERVRFIERLHRSTRIRCFPSWTSFVLMALPKGLKAPAVCHGMAERKILIRDCSNFTGLSARFIRLSLKQREENRNAAMKLIHLCQETGDVC